MRIQFDQQMERLHVELIRMGSLCEEGIALSAKALQEKNPAFLQRIAAVEVEIDDKEREIEDLCMRLILQQQPVARDLRFISAALKMISDMERIGDQAYDIAEITKFIKEDRSSFNHDHISVMADTAIQMVTESVDSFVKRDMDLANKVILKDDIVDELFDKVKDDLITAVTEDKDCAEYFIDILMIAKYLERISDHAVNIAEWVIFSITGEHVNEKNIEKDKI